jgi:hypothetical protein
MLHNVRFINLIRHITIYYGKIAVQQSPPFAAKTDGEETEKPSVGIF